MAQIRSSEEAIAGSPTDSPRSSWGRVRRRFDLAQGSLPDGRAPLNVSARIFQNYGTVPPSRSNSDGRRLQNDNLDGRPVSPPFTRLPRVLSTTSSLLQRPISTYDKVLEENSPEYDTHVNGIRFWYSTFTSIDWLHDSIKESARALQLRQRRSFRGRIINAWDRCLGWIVVTIVGVLTAITAFVIVRLEQWLFDIKEGYCTDGWWKAKRFCCPTLESTSITALLHPGISDPKPFAAEAQCHSWTTWAERLQPRHGDPPQIASLVEYIAYSFFALVLALASAWLTIRFTASTSFDGSEASALTSSVMEIPRPSGPSSGPKKRKTMYFAAGSGIPELKCIMGGFVMRGYLGGRTLLTKGVGLSLSVASGLALGKEGPFVHIAACWGNIVSRWFVKYELNEAKRREILSAASAAGVAVAFGAPVGGVLFSLEEVSYFFPAKVMWRSFFCAMIASMTLGFLDPFGTGQLVLFQVTYDKPWHAYELIFFLALGVFGGLYGAYFTKAHVLWVRHVRSTRWFQEHPILEVLMVTIVTTMLCFLNTYTRMGGTELVYNLFSECHADGTTHEGLCVPKYSAVSPLITAIGSAMIIKAALTVITFGIKLPAGIFIPTLGVGACFGRILGIGIEYFQWYHPQHPIFDACRSFGDNDCVVPGLYAMVGAAAALSGVTRTTISLAVIVFELTGTMTYVVPVMLSVLVAKNVADFFQPSGIYDSVIELAQLPYLDCKHDYLWGSRTLHDVVDSKVEVIRADKEPTVQSLLDQLHRTAGLDIGSPVLVREDSILKVIGYIGHNELEHALSIVGEDLEAECYFRRTFSPPEIPSSASFVEDLTARDPYDFTIYMDQAPLTVNINAPLEAVHQMFAKMGARYVIVSDGDGGYEGVLDKKAWIAFVNGIPQA